MIRRDATGRSGEPVWLLIEQLGHAELAGQLASQWRWPATPAFGREALLAAVDHHDDGWATWDAAPGLDREGKPLAFTEMPVLRSIAIWTESIRVVARIGPLATYMVAGHFRALLERHDSWRSGPEETIRGAENFLQMAAKHMAEANGAWRAADSPAVDPRDGARLDADESLHWLQAFDAISLWLCCTPRAVGDFTVPEGTHGWPPRGAIRLRRLAERLRLESAGSQEMVRFEERILAEPWPWAKPSLRLETTARMAPAAPIARDHTPLGQIGEPIAIAWTFAAGESDPEERSQ